MNNFDHLDALMRKTEEIESSLQRMRDNVDLPTNPAINRALNFVQTMRDGLWLVDKALKKAPTNQYGLSGEYKSIAGPCPRARTGGGAGHTRGHRRARTRHLARVWH